jgi:hypothetical protein
MTTDLSGPSPAILSSTTAPKRHGRRLLTLGFVASTIAALLVGGMSGTASAAPGDTSADTTVAHVGVNSAINLTGLTGEFTLNAAPGASVSENGVVTMTVETNNIGGYVVAVQSRTDTLLPLAVGNTDSIPIANLHVRQTGGSTFLPLSSATPVTVHSQPGRSAVGGDFISNDYLVDVPFVATDTYSASLDYVATTL